jgi:hypothetical protein
MVVSVVWLTRVRQAVSSVSKAHKNGTNHSRKTATALLGSEKSKVYVYILGRYEFMERLPVSLKIDGWPCAGCSWSHDMRMVGLLMRQ